MITDVQQSAYSYDLFTKNLPYNEFKTVSKIDAHR